MRGKRLVQATQSERRYGDLSRAVREAALEAGLWLMCCGLHELVHAVSSMVDGFSGQTHFLPFTRTLATPRPGIVRRCAAMGCSSSLSIKHGATSHDSPRHWQR